MHKLILDPASALKMQWGKNIYHQDFIKVFFEHLDLSAGDDLYEKCISIRNWYPEIIINRKYCIDQ